MQPVPALSNHPASREAHLRDYWKILWQGRWTVIAIFVVVIGITAVWTFLQTPIYEAVATIEVQTQARRVMGNQQDVSGLGSNSYGWFAEEKYHNTQMDIIRSRDVASRVVRTLDLQSHALFVGQSDPVEAFRRMVRVDPRRDTGLLEISISGPSPEEVTQWTNAVADEYVNRNIEKARGNLDKSLAAIQNQFADLGQELSEAEDVRIGSLEKSEIIDTESQQKIIQSKLESFDSQATEVRIDLNRLEDTLRRVDQMRVSGQDLMNMPELAKDSMLENLHEEALKLERELSSHPDLLEKHPTYESKKKELDEARRSVQRRLDTLVASMESERDLLRDNAAYLATQIREARQTALQMAKATSRYDLVRSDSATKKKLFEAIATSIADIRVQAELMNNNVAVLDYAPVPRYPIKPSKRTNLAIGTLLGLCLGVGAAFFLDYLDNTIRTPEDIEKHLGVAVLGVVPKMKDASLAQRAVQEAYQSLRTSIIFSSKNREHRLLLITSTGPQEGKSSTVSNLARMLAAAGDRVIVLDCDLRRPRQHVHFKLEREPGLTNYLAAAESDRNWAQYLQSPGPGHLHLLTCGPLPPSPPELLGSNRFRELLAELRSRYDWVLIDSPPAFSLADSSVLASIAEMTLVVVQYSRTDRDHVIKTVQQLRSVRANIIGAVLNNVDMQRGFHKDYYYAGYYTDEGSTKRRREREPKAQVG